MSRTSEVSNACDQCGVDGGSDPVNWLHLSSLGTELVSWAQPSPFGDEGEAIFCSLSCLAEWAFGKATERERL